LHRQLEALKAKRPDLFAKLPANPTEADYARRHRGRARSCAAGVATQRPRLLPHRPPPGAPVVGRAEPRPAAPAQDPTMRELIIDRAFEGRTLPEKIKARVTAELMARGGVLTIAEAREAIDGWVADVAPTHDVVGGTGLGTTVRTTKDAADKAIEALDGLFMRKPVNGQQFTSVREAYITITGDTGLTGLERNAKNLRSFQRFFEARAEQAQEALTTASFGEIFGDSIRRAMVAQYKDPGYLDDWRKIVSDVSSISDFRTNRRMRLGGYGDLSTVAEAGRTPRSPRRPTKRRRTASRRRAAPRRSPSR
jgi:hypothetical protein